MFILLIINADNIKIAFIIDRLFCVFFVATDPCMLANSRTKDPKSTRLMVDKLPGHPTQNLKLILSILGHMGVDLCNRSFVGMISRDI